MWLAVLTVLCAMACLMGSFVATVLWQAYLQSSDEGRKDSEIARLRHHVATLVMEVDRLKHHAAGRRQPVPVPRRAPAPAPAPPQRMVSPSPPRPRVPVARPSTFVEEDVADRPTVRECGTYDEISYGSMDPNSGGEWTGRLVEVDEPGDYETADHLCRAHELRRPTLRTDREENMAAPQFARAREVTGPVGVFQGHRAGPMGDIVRVDRQEWSSGAWSRDTERRRRYGG